MHPLGELRAAIHTAVPGKLTDPEADNLILFIRLLMAEELMGSSELRHRLNLGPQAINMRIHRRLTEGKPGVPEPVVKLKCGYIFFRPDVEEYIRENPDAVYKDVSQQEAS